MTTPCPQTGDVPPPIQVIHLLNGSVVTQLLSLAAELGIADLVDDEPRDVAELARRTGSEPDALYRMLRALASVGVFTEAGPRIFGTTPLARTLRTGTPDSVRGMALAAGREPRQRALIELRKSIRTGRPAFDQVHGTDFWSYLAAHSEADAAFYRSMSDGIEQYGAVTLESIDLSTARLVIDVGGGRGHLMAAILPRYPQLRAVIFDRAEAIASAGEVLASAGVDERTKLVAGDFFESVPAGGDVYVLSGILHDWDDRQATAILTNIRRAMRPDGRVLVIETVLPESDAPHLGKLADIAMLALLGGRERTEAEFASLLRAAGLRHAQTRTTSELGSLIVATAAPVPDGSATGRHVLAEPGR